MQNYLKTEMDIIDEWNFARFEFKVGFVGLFKLQ